MAKTTLVDTYVRALMVLGKAPPKMTTIQVGEKLFDPEAVDAYCRWLDYYGEMEKYYVFYVMGLGLGTRTEDWCKGFMEWQNIQTEPRVSDFYHRAPTPAILHACKRRTT